MDPERYCRDRAAPPGSGLHYALGFVAPSLGPAVCAIEALRLALAEIIDSSADPGVARQRVQWWANEVRAARDGHPSHPVTRALAGRPGADPGVAECLDAMITGTAALLERGGFASEGDVDAYCDAVGGGTFEGFALAAGPVDGSERAACRRVGGGVARSELLRPGNGFGPPPEQAIALETRKAHRVTGECFSQRPTPDPLREALADGAGRAARALDTGLGALSGQRADPILVVRALGEMERARLRSLARIRYRVNDRRTGITPLGKLWIAWRTSRHRSPTR